MEGRTATTQTVTLLRHPASKVGPIDSISVMVDREDAALWLRFVAKGRVDEVSWPKPVDPGRVDDLWRHTCFEAFVATDDGYVEYNISPSGQWASYRFDGPRAGMRLADEAATAALLDWASDLVAAETQLELPYGARQLGLAAVIEGKDGAFSYWALAHPSDKPDFHHPNSFILELP